MTESPTELPAPEPDEEVRETVEVLAVRVGGADFGIRVERVHSVIRVPAITRLPFPPPSIVGVVSVRGSLVPVLDLGDRLLGRPAARSGRIVLVDDGDAGQTIGLLVDGVVSLVTGSLDVQDVPAEVEASLPAGWVTGILRAPDEQLITLLDLEPVLAVGVPTDKEQR
jgi:chemotaxis signal transduction protein